MNELFETQDIWVGACLVYTYGTDVLARITDHDLDGNDRRDRRRATTYSFAVTREDAETVQQDYATGKLGLTDARSFVGSFNSITQRQRAMRHRGETSWCSPAWIAGEVG